MSPDSTPPNSPPAAGRRPHRLGLLWALAGLAAGCAAPDPNPAVARANTGYVDFHTDRPDELCWEVARFDDRTQDFQRLHSELAPPPAGVLRVALPPGTHRLRISFLNRVVREPAILPVDVKDGMVTPVRVRFSADGTALVQNAEKQLGGTAKGRYGRRTKFSADETTLYRLSAEAGPTVAYQVRERMPYAH